MPSWGSGWGFGWDAMAATYSDWSTFPLFGYAWPGLIRWGERETDEASSPLVPIPVGSLDVSTTATERLYKQLEGAQTWQDLAAMLAELFGEVEDALEQVDLQRFRLTAFGQQLTDVGDLVGQPRGSLVDDELFRLAIQVEASTLGSSGLFDEVEEIGIAIGGSAELTDFEPAAFRMRIPDLDADRFALLLQILADVPASGVGALLSTFDSASAGGWSSVYGATPGPAAAWSSVYGATTSTRAHWSTARGIGT